MVRRAGHLGGLYRPARTEVDEVDEKVCSGRIAPPDSASVFCLFSEPRGRLHEQRTSDRCFRRPVPPSSLNFAFNLRIWANPTSNHAPGTRK